MSTITPARRVVVEPAAFWSTVLPREPNLAWLADATRIWLDAQKRRAIADYNTGSITEEQAYCLRALAEYVQPRVVIEVGTFIGASALTLAMPSSVTAVYTCDVSNDCLPNHGMVLHTYPRRTSTDMLRDLVERGVRRVDLCFFDGALAHSDVQLLGELMHARTVFAFDDYNYGPKERVKNGVVTLEHGIPRKGIGNVNLLKPHLPHHVLIEPPEGSILALLVPESMA